LLLNIQGNIANHCYLSQQTATGWKPQKILSTTTMSDMMSLFFEDTNPSWYLGCVLADLIEHKSVIASILPRD
jgi:hypothetical protein